MGFPSTGFLAENPWRDREEGGFSSKNSLGGFAAKEQHQHTPQRLLTYIWVSYLSVLPQRRQHPPRSMGKPSSQPPGPVTQQCNAGREQFRRLFKAWSRQWTQPQLLKLVSAGLTDNVVWSSQLTGFATGVLVDPAPKVLMALGRFNLLLARSNGYVADQPTAKEQPTASTPSALTAGKLPGALSTLWEGRAAMVDATGNPLGPAEVFLVFTGELDLQLPDALEIPLEVEEAVTKAFGKAYRQQLAANGIDFVDDDQQRLLKLCPSMKGLITGKAVRGEQLITDLPVLAAELGVAQQDLQDTISELLAA